MNVNVDKIRDWAASLRNINIKDLQNIDAQQLGDMLRQRVDIVLNITLVLVTMVATVLIVKGSGKRSEMLTWEIKQLEERGEAVKESERLKGEYSAFLKSFPEPILTDQLINKLSEFAADQQVQILSFSPVKEKSDNYIKVAGVQINVSSDSYKNIVLFMKDVGDAHYALHVGQWSAKMKEQRVKEGTEEFRKQTVEANMQISAIQFKDE
ncbi:MAG: type 4a pilus biogenesis protein PilO [Candidatus Omnitrophica bacterium]|nr:type 4a pilus biogenesis protein PilO [Candidatus Omnitrophota bacterium]